MARKYQQRHYEDTAAILRDVLAAGGDHHTVARIVFQFGKLYEDDSREASPKYRFNESRFVLAVFPEGPKR